MRDIVITSKRLKDNTILSSIMKGEYNKVYKELEENPNMIIMVLVLIIIFLLLIIFKKEKIYLVLDFLFLVCFLRFYKQLC